MPLIDLEVGMTEKPSPFQSVLEQRSEEVRNSQNTVKENVVEGLQGLSATSVGVRGIDEGQAALDSYNTDNPDQVGAGNASDGLLGMTKGQMGAYIGGFARGAVGLEYETGEEWVTRRDDLMEMTAGLSQDDREALWSYKDKDAAIRALGRINATRARHTRTAMQFDGGSTRFVASLIDLDLVLGPGLAVNRLRKAAALITKSRFAQRRIVGAAAGAQAGALVGGAQAMTDDTANEATFVLNILMGATAGSVLGGPTAPLRKSSEDMYAMYKNAIDSNDPKLTAVYTDPVRAEGPSRITATNEVLEGSATTGLEVEPLMSEVGSIGAARIVPEHVKKEYADAVNDGASDTDLLRILNTPAPTYAAGLRVKAPEVNISTVSEAIINQSQEEMLVTGTLAARNVRRTIVEDVSTSRLSYLSGTHFQSALANSRASTALYMGRNIFESSTGVLRGEDNAAMLAPIYTGQIADQIRLVPKVRVAWAQSNMPSKMTSAKGMVGGTTQEATRAFNRAVMLERNARQFGAEFTPTKGATTDDIHILEAADMYDKAAPVARDRLQGFGDETPVRGTRDIEANPHYNPQRLVGSSVLNLIGSGKITRKATNTALAKGLRSGNANLNAKDADLIAEAMVARAEAREVGTDMQAMALLEGDGSAWLEDTLISNGVPKKKVASILKRLRGDKAERSKLGSTKRRNTVDMSIQIGDTDLQLVDLFDTDLDTAWGRYSREVGGSAALARHGIDSKAAREEWITAMQAEQRAMGETPMHANEMRAMFSKFDSGPTKGWSPFAPDNTPVAAEQWVGSLQNWTNLAWLNKIAFAQSGEYGGMIWQAGFKNWFNMDIMRQFDAGFRANDARLLDEFGGDFMYTVGKDELIFKPHLDLDNMHDTVDKSIMSMIHRGTQEASRIQGQVTFFNAIKSRQQQVAAKMAMNTIFRDIKRGFDLPGGTVTDHQRKLLWNNFGISDAFLLDLEGLVHTGAIEFDATGHVLKLNGDKWASPTQRHKFGALIMRNIDQVVQKSAAGEQDAWMSTVWGKMMTHLKTFPMQATQKQLVRLLRNGNADALGATMFGLMTAGVASVARAGLDGKLDTMTFEDHAKRSFGYSNVTGFVPMAADPILTMMGHDDKRFNQYGKHAEVGGMASLEWANDALRIVGAVNDATKGEADYDDKAALRTLPFANLPILGDYMTSLGQANK